MERLAGKQIDDNNPYFQGGNVARIVSGVLLARGAFGAFGITRRLAALPYIGKGSLLFARADEFQAAYSTDINGYAVAGVGRGRQKEEKTYSVS